MELCATSILSKLEVPRGTVTLSDVMGLLATPIDKYLFVMFRDQQLTVDQVRSRLAQTTLNINYTILDDLKGMLDPSILERSGPEHRAAAFKIYRKKEMTA